VGKLASWLAMAGAAAAAALAPPATAAPPCAPWEMREIASGLGSLENVLPDGMGGLLVSATDQGAILRVTPDGQSALFVPNVTAPGGMRIRDDVLYFNTGDALASGAQNRADGTIERFDLMTQERETFARGLTMPNGLAVLPNGDFVTSRDVGGGGTGITRVPFDDPGHPQTQWVATSDSNGMAVDPSGTYLYFVETFTNESNVYRVLIADPSKVDVVAGLGGTVPPKGLDDMTIDGDGILYVAANGAGEVIRLDPRDGSQCVIAGGMRNTSAAKFGAGPGWPDTHLFVVGFDGVVRELTPPADQTPTPPGAKPSPAAPGPVAKPAMTLTAHPRSIPRGRRSCVRFTARAEGKRVREAAVRFVRKTKDTDSRGNAVFCVRPRRTGALRASASKPGLKRATTKVRVRA
jgi:sugar lactone lactonase YvrE